MAKIKKRRLKWNASSSHQVVGYRLYWIEGKGVSYSSAHVDLGNITDITLPDDVPALMPCRGPVEFGITAIDELGNESNMVVISAPYQFSVPEPPSGLKIETLPDYFVTGDAEVNTDTPALTRIVTPDFPVRRSKPVSKSLKAVNGNGKTV